MKPTHNSSLRMLPSPAARKLVQDQALPDSGSCRGIALAAGLLAMACVGADRSFGASTLLSFSGASYAEDFDDIPTAQTSSIATAAPGWVFYRSTAGAGATFANPIAITPTYTSGSTSTAVTQYAGSGGTSGTGVVTSSSSGGAYLWVSGVRDSGTDKSIGFLTTGSYPGTTADVGQQLAVMFGFTNDTGGTITELDLSWNYERYRMGSRTQSWQFHTSSDGATWNALALGNGPLMTGTSNAVVFDPPQSTAKSVSLTGLEIPAGGNHYFRWSLVTTGSWSNSQGSGIDDFTMTARTVPEPTVLGFAAGGLALCFAFRRRK